MLRENQEIISVQRRSSEDMFRIGCDMADATKNIPPDLMYRERLLPDIGHLRVANVDYVMTHMYPQRVDANGTSQINRWTGLVVEHDRQTNDPRIIGCLCVRPNIPAPFRKPKFEFNKQPFAIIDSWNVAENHDEVLAAQLQTGLDVVSKLFPKNIALVFESYLNKRRNKQYVQEDLPLDGIFEKYFKYLIADGEIHRYDPARTLLRDGVQKGYGIVRANKKIC